MATPKSRRWDVFGEKSCKTGCRISMGTEGPHCQKRVPSTFMPPNAEYQKGLDNWAEKARNQKGKYKACSNYVQQSSKGRTYEKRKTAKVL